jgi:hypothetical protein
MSGWPPLVDFAGFFGLVVSPSALQGAGYQRFGLRFFSAGSPGTISVLEVEDMDRRRPELAFVPPTLT